MPVIVVGADTPTGAEILSALHPVSGEIRAFVTDPTAGNQLRNVAKVAVGDVSDGSHVGGAAIGAFCAIVVATSAHDGRERSFAATPVEVLGQWADGLIDAGVRRIIAVGSTEEIPHPNPLQRAADYKFVDTNGKGPTQVAAFVAELEAAP